MVVKNNKRIIHHKITVRVVFILDQDAHITASAKHRFQHQQQNRPYPSYIPLMDDSNAGSSTFMQGSNNAARRPSHAGGAWGAPVSSVLTVDLLSILLH